MISRRDFFKLSCFGFMIFLPGWKGNANKKDDIMSFYAAGVRFLNRIPIVEEGTPVNLKMEEFDNEVCFGIYTNDGSKIGYVPRRLVPEIRFRSIGRSYLSSVKPLAVPWERFGVTVLIPRTGA
jgi:hypothetical protein